MKTRLPETDVCSDLGSVLVEAGSQWAVCPKCGDLNALGAEYWEAVSLAGEEEAPARCATCGAVYTVKIEGTRVVLAAGLTREQVIELGSRLEGTCAAIESVLEGMGLESENFDILDIEDQLLDLPESIERCSGCGWWVYSWALVDENGDAGECEQCRESEVV